MKLRGWGTEVGSSQENRQLRQQGQRFGFADGGHIGLNSPFHQKRVNCSRFCSLASYSKIHTSSTLEKDIYGISSRWRIWIPADVRGAQV